jgi:pilus assembly protein CpaB
MNRRALLIAFVVSLVGVVLLVLYTRRFERDASGGERIRLLVALKPIERGKPITEDALTVREVPQAYVEDRAIKEVEKAKVLGLKVGTSIQAQQTLMWTDLVTANEERRDLSSLVQPGMRAVSIRTHRDDTSSAMIKPGDYVDVIGVVQEGFGSNDQRTALVLLQRVLVLAAGFETSPDQMEKKQYQQESVLTLSLTLSQAQLLALASEKATLSVALRNPEDPLKPEQPRLSSSVLTSEKGIPTTFVQRPVGPVEIPRNPIQ